MSEADHFKKTFVAKDGTRLFYRHSDFRYAKRVLVMHGLMEHSERYPDMLRRIFGEKQVSWVIFDFRGHGLSEGPRNEVEPETFLRDAYEMIRHLGWEEGSFSGLAHSFGGLFALYLTLKNPVFFKSLALSAPFLGMPDFLSRIQVDGISLIAGVLPFLKIEDPCGYRYLTHDKNMIREYKKDHLMDSKLSLGTLGQIRKMQEAVKKLRHLEIPLLVMMGTKEKIVSRKAIRRWARDCRAPHLEKVFFKGLFHELLFELHNEKVLQTVSDFVFRK